MLNKGLLLTLDALLGKVASAFRLPIMVSVPANHSIYWFLFFFFLFLDSLLSAFVTTDSPSSPSELLFVEQLERERMPGPSQGFNFQFHSFSFSIHVANFQTRWAIGAAVPGVLFSAENAHQSTPWIGYRVYGLHTKRDLIRPFSFIHVLSLEMDSFLELSSLHSC